MMRRFGSMLTLAGAAGLVAAGFALDHEWKATLAPGGGSSITGEAEIEREGNGSKAEIEIRGATAGQQLPWHVHKGRCGSDGGIWGAATDYKPLIVERDGEAESEAMIAMPLPASGEYFVNVHKAADDLKTIVSCGNLAMTGDPSSKEKAQAPARSGY